MERVCHSDEVFELDTDYEHCHIYKFVGHQPVKQLAAWTTVSVIISTNNLWNNN